MRIDLTNQEFGKLTALRPTQHKGRSAWITRCSCGFEKPVRTENLINGVTRSCARKGCIEYPQGTSSRSLPKGIAPKSKVIRIYKRHALERNLVFELTFEQFVKLCESNCTYCGSIPSTIMKTVNENWIYNGIDRKDNTFGYTELNSLPCCRICNRAKNNLPYKEFTTYLDRIASYRK